MANELPLVRALEREVKAWVDQGWQGVTQTTYELLSYWFERDEEAGERFHDCQRLAIETIIYCHEILGISTFRDAYERLAPEALSGSAALTEEAAGIPFAKYALKMATGTGKTWVLAALLVWQYFNAQNGERPGKYSAHFMLVAPGHEVLNRLLDMFLGKHDPKTGFRDKSRSDFARTLFVPEGERWRNRFHVRVLEPSDIRANMTPPDEPFVYITNWQQFRLNDATNLWDQLTGADVEDQPRGEVIADFLSEYPDLVIFNDEAHHVHGNRTARGEELVWRRFVRTLYDRITERHEGGSGCFLQIDFSATPFFGSGERREYFPHIVYDYDLVDAMRAMLVKQIFLEERELGAGDLRITAERAPAEGDHQRGAVVGLAPDQKLLLDIGRKKLGEIAQEFRTQGLNKKPVLFVLAESTGVADLIAEHLGNLTDERGKSYREQTLVIHSDMQGRLGDKEWEVYRRNLETLDEPEETNPYRIVVSVLMLREGFDTQNVCVTVVLRSAEADLLLEQIVGRGVRLMFPANAYPELQDLKMEAREDVMRNRLPKNSLDFLFVVEHPRFRSFYEELRAKGYAIAIGDSAATRVTGDLVPVEATPERIKNYDLLWPIQIFEQAPRPDLSGFDVSQLPKYSVPFEVLKREVGKLSVTERAAETGGRMRTWRLENEYFDYNHFLRQASLAISRDRSTQVLTAALAEITRILDEYASERLFGEPVDFRKSENYQVLNYTPLFDFIVERVRRAIIDQLGEIQYEAQAGKIGRASDVKKIFVRDSLAVSADRCIYPKIGYSRRGEGFERDFIDETLKNSAEVLAFVKLQERKHAFNISYRDRHGIRRDYYPDFVVKTETTMYIVETKSDDDFAEAQTDDMHQVVLKAKAARRWCATASSVKIIGQPKQWEYLLLPEKLFRENHHLGFDGLIGLCRVTTETLLTRQEGRLL